MCIRDSPDDGRIMRVYDKNSIDQDGTAILGKAKIIRMEEWKQMFREGKAPARDKIVDVSLLPNDYKVEPGTIVLDRLRTITHDGLTYMESMMAAHHKEAVNVRPEDPLPSIFSKAFAIRIPTQDKHSAANLKIVDFLPPIYSSSIMVAQELIEISGSDFDIDKLYAQMAAFYHLSLIHI